MSLSLFPSIESYLELVLSYGTNWATLMIYTPATYKSRVFFLSEPHMMYL